MGFFVELLGVKTGLIFGNYHYGATFGAKWQDVPYLIGLNWAAMVFYTSSFLAPRIKNTVVRAFAGGGSYDRLRFLPRTRCHAFRLLGLEKWHHSTPKLRRLVHIRHPLSPPAQQHQQTHKKPHGLYPLLHPRRIFHHTLRICASVLTKKLPFLREAFQALATRYIDTRFTADILFRHT